ncbi:MAG: SpoIIE family protein phosphatase [Syntrophaceae bacterium]
MTRVFLVESDKRLAKTVAKRLSDLDCSVDIFHDPKEALQAFIEHVPTVVVTEIDLPKGGGLDMISQMHAFNNAGVIIVFTNLDDKRVLRDLVRIGADDLIDKQAPHAVKTLIQAVEQALARTDGELKKRGIQRNRRSAELLRTLVDSLPAGLLVVDHDGHVVIWNRSARDITGIETTTVRGKRLDTLPAIVQELLDPSATRITRQDSQGEVRYMEKILRSIQLEQDRRNMVVVFTDTTDLMRARLDMEQSMMEMAETKDLMEEQAAQLAIALAEVDEKNAIIEDQNQRMVHELEMAGELQKSLLPDIYQSVGGISFASKYISSIQIGGDLYDVVDQGPGLTGFLIADVSGHGVAAALVASMFKMSFHTHAANVASPKVLFHMLNDEIKPILAEDYITAFYLIVDRDRNTITYTNAGHPNPLLYRRARGEIIELDTNGFFIGMFDDGDYEEKTISIEEGDALLLYTDCIIETENADGEQFGRTRLIELFTSIIADKHGQEVIDTLERELRAFSATESLNDDFTCLILEFMELASAPAAPAPSDESHGGEFEEF